MLFNSFQFVCFFVIVTGVYFSIPHKFRWLLLLLSSCYFYMAFVPIYLLILGFTIIIDYWAGILIENSSANNKKIFLIISLVANIGVLAIFKYYNFLNDNISIILSDFGLVNKIPALTILLPIGLSFHTFQAMSYTIEVYRGNQKAERHFGIYALYVMFFPQLVAGPIERPQNLLFQFYRKFNFEHARVVKGLQLMLWGFFLKVVIADNLADIVNLVYTDVHNYKGISLIIATLAFSIQIYCDFSGYSLIAIGAALVMGFNLMKNFNRPYFAKSLKEFWTRWHISLSTWFKDYLYIPLGGNKCNKMTKYRNLLIVFTISGLWHGANWTYIIWGVIHGFILIIESVFSWKNNSWLSRSGFTNWTNRLITLFVVAFAWIFFRANNVNDAVYIIKNSFQDDFYGKFSKFFSIQWISDNFIKYKMYTIFFMLILFFVSFYQEKYGSISIYFNRKSRFIRWFVYLLILFSIFLFGSNDDLKFIYFQF